MVSRAMHAMAKHAMAKLFHAMLWRAGALAADGLARVAAGVLRELAQLFEARAHVVAVAFHALLHALQRMRVCAHRLLEGARVAAELPRHEKHVVRQLLL